MSLSKHILQLTLVLILGSSLFLRMWHINFGLPHSFYADEPEIAEIAIKYTYELKDVLQNNNWYKLVPVSYVYGAFPSMFLAVITIVFSKTAGILHIPFDKTTLYVLMRALMVLFSFSIVLTSGFLAYKITKCKAARDSKDLKNSKDTKNTKNTKNTSQCLFITITTIILLSLNWKFIVHAHYVNADIIVSALLSASFLTAFLYYKKSTPDTFYTFLTALFYGFAVGTKITVLITLPLYLLLFLKKREYRSLFAFLFLIFGAFVISNPFSLIYANTFVFRIYEMFFKEAGLVFDSVDYSSFKYLSALSLICTFPVLLFAGLGIFNTLSMPKISSLQKDKTFDWFLVLHIIIYLIFYSIQSRRVDRWILPIVPIVILYSSLGFYYIQKVLPKYLFYALLFLIGVVYLLPISTLLHQFQRYTPKSAAYLWMRDNTDPLKRKLVYTEEGLDPLNKLAGARVIQVNVYSGEGAQYLLPEPLDLYDYVVLSSRPMEYYKKPLIHVTYPFYFEKWYDFENTVRNSGKFKLLKSFPTTTPNLIPLSSVEVWERVLD